MDVRKQQSSINSHPSTVIHLPGEADGPACLLNYSVSWNYRDACICVIVGPSGSWIVCGQTLGNASVWVCVSSVERMWPEDWSSEDAGMRKRNMAVADDAAFREKSKLLTSMERQKWLNSYMQKLLVVKSS